MEILEQINVVTKSMVDILQNATVIITFATLFALSAKVGIPKTKEGLFTMLFASSTSVLFFICWYRRGFNQTYSKFHDLAELLVTPTKSIKSKEVSP